MQTSNTHWPDFYAILKIIAKEEYHLMIQLFSRHEDFQNIRNLK